MSETRKALCMHCGHEAHYQVGDEESQAKAWQELLDHDAVCPQNPLIARVSALETENAALAEVADEYVNTAHRYRDALAVIADPATACQTSHETVDALRAHARRALNP